MPMLTFAQLWNRVYQPSGYSDLDGTLNKQSADTKKAQKFLESNITRIATFLGWPAGLSDLENEEQSWTNVFLQFIGWHVISNPWLKIFAVLGVTAWNLVTWLPILARNVLKLFTEVLPYSLMMMTDGLRQSFKKDGQRQSNAGFSFVNPIVLLLTVLFAAAYVMYFIGRAITSPLDSLLLTWKESANKTPYPLLNTAIQVVATSLSMLATVAVYAVIAMFAAPLLAHLIAPAIATIAPAWLMPALHGISIAAVSTMQFVGSLLPAVGIPATLGLQAFFLVAALTAAFVVVGRVVKSIYNRIGDWVYGQPEQPVKAPAVPATSDPAASLLLSAAPAVIAVPDPVASPSSAAPGALDPAVPAESASASSDPAVPAEPAPAPSLDPALVKARELAEALESLRKDSEQANADLLRLADKPGAVFDDELRLACSKAADARAKFLAATSSFRSGSSETAEWKLARSAADSLAVAPTAAARAQKSSTASLCDPLSEAASLAILREVETCQRAQELSKYVLDVFDFKNAVVKDCPDFAETLNNKVLPLAEEAQIKPHLEFRRSSLETNRMLTELSGTLRAIGNDKKRVARIRSSLMQEIDSLPEARANKLKEILSTPTVEDQLDVLSPAAASPQSAASNLATTSELGRLGVMDGVLGLPADMLGAAPDAAESAASSALPATTGEDDYPDDPADPEPEPVVVDTARAREIEALLKAGLEVVGASLGNVKNRLIYYSDSEEFRQDLAKFEKTIPADLLTRYQELMRLEAGIKKRNLDDLYADIMRRQAEIEGLCTTSPVEAVVVALAPIATSDIEKRLNALAPDAYVNELAKVTAIEQEKKENEAETKAQLKLITDEMANIRKQADIRAKQAEISAKQQAIAEVEGEDAKEVARVNQVQKVEAAETALARLIARVTPPSSAAAAAAPSSASTVESAQAITMNYSRLVTRH